MGPVWSNNRRRPWHVGVRFPGVALLSLLSAAVLLPQTSLAGKADVGGHRLHYRAGGKGDVAVVFDGGWGSSLETWHWIVPEIKSMARYVVYDRAGLGRSEPGPLPRTGRRSARELRALLRSAGVPGPFVLVGHSMGGLHVQSFALEFPDDVCGVLLVDTTPLAYPEREASFRDPGARAHQATALAVAPPAWRQELDAVPDSVREIREAGPWPRIPVIQLSADRQGESGVFRRAWQAMQRTMAARLNVRRHQVVEGSGHNIHFERPEVVVRAIRELVDEACPSPTAPRRGP